MNSSVRLKVAVLVSHPIQYLSPVFRHLSASCTLDFKVLYRSNSGNSTGFDPGFQRSVKWDVPLFDGYKYEFLSFADSRLRSIIAVVLRLTQERPDVLIVHGYNHPTSIIAMIVAKILGSKLLLRGDTRFTKNNRHAGLIKSTVKRAIFSTADGFLTIGAQNQDFYVAHGATRDRCHFVPLAVDNAAFSSSAHPSNRLSVRRKIRGELGIPESALVFVFVGKFIPRKRLLDAVLAYQTVAHLRPDVYLCVVGSGPEENSVKAWCMHQTLDRVIFVGFKNQSEIPPLLAACDVGVVPSEDEPWGLVVNEMLAAGLPVVASDEVGAAVEMLREGNAGFLYRCGDISELGNLFRRFVLRDNLAAKMSAAALRTVEPYSIEACASRIETVAIRLTRLGEARM